MKTFHVKPQTSAERQEFCQRLDRQNAAPLWNVLGEIVTSEPRSSCVPALWHYRELRPLLMESGQLITAKEAERRVLILENPGARGLSRITQSLYAGLQLVLPGEITASHRHVASALRFVIEGEGAYTALDGKRATMRPGDFILTPSWTFHDHGNPGEEPVVWLDGLDIPTVNFFDTSFAEHYPEDGTQPVESGSGDSFAHPYERSREELHRRYRDGAVHPCHGVKMRYVTAMPTMGACLQLLPSGFRGAASRSTDATVYCAADGHGRSHVGDCIFEWGVHDVFVVPSWCPVSHENDSREDAVLFSFSDRPAQEALGLWRES